MDGQHSQSPPSANASLPTQRVGDRLPSPDKTLTFNEPVPDSDIISGPSNCRERVILEIAGGLQALKKILKSEVGLFEKEILYRAGLGWAGEYFEKKQAGLKSGSPASTLNEILHIYTSEGLGDYRVEKIDDGTRTVEITAKNGFEAMTLSDSTELQAAPSCSYTSGFLAGICKHAFDDEEMGPAEIFAIEVECVAQGKERCKFIVAPVRELERSGHKVECKEESISEHTFRLNEEILLRNLDLQNLALTLERKVRKRTEELRRSEENYRSLINLSPDPILIIAMDGRILSGNRSCLSLLGYEDRSDLEGHHIDDILPKGSDAFSALKWALDKEGSAHNFEMDLDTKFDEVTTVEASARVAEIDKESCIQTTLRDVTERSRLERQLVEAKEESDFLNDLLSHDIINHTTAAMHFLEKLERSQSLSESERKDMKTVSKAIRGAHELSSVVRDAKRVGALGSNDCESKNLVTVLLDAIDESKRTYAYRKVTVNFTPPIEPCRVRGSPLLTRLFTNLLTNAIKFDHNEEVVVDVDIVAAHEEGDDYWRVSIADYGRGIMDDEKPKIFERYYRQDHSIPGAGLGLHLVNHLVECCGGTIRVENRVEGDHRKGTVMITSLKKITNGLNRDGRSR